MDTDFLLGGGFALLLALLGWSDQIRGVQDRTRVQEKALLDACLSTWDTLAPVLRPSEQANPFVQLRAVLNLIQDGTLKSGEEATLLKSFREIDQRRARLEKVYRTRYQLVFMTTFLMFVFGIYGAAQLKPAAFLGQVVVSILVFLLLILTAVIARLEDKFRELLNAIEDRLRSSTAMNGK